MKIIHDEIKINTRNETELVDITDKINNIIQSNNIKEGIVNIHTKHTTSSIIINENEEGLKKDILSFYDNIIPFDDYAHDKIDNNARSHLKAVLSSSNQNIPINKYRLDLGVWQSVFFVEHDGPRHSRTILITIIG